MNEDEVNTDQLNWDDESDNQLNEREFNLTKYKFYASEVVRYEVIIEADTEDEAFTQYEGLDVRKDSEVSREYFTTNKVERLTE